MEGTCLGHRKNSQLASMSKSASELGDSSGIPQGPQEITAEWLSADLRGVAPGARAKAVELVDAHSGTTGLRRACG